jgi:hypothetical protein
VKTSNQITAELKAAFDDKEIKGEDKTVLSESPYFRDYVRIGAWLSYGLRARAKSNGDPIVRNALLALEADMISRIGKYYSQSSRAVAYFKRQRPSSAVVSENFLLKA